jgi:ribosomal protein S18 acetylase RimI-like enzyme
MCINLRNSTLSETNIAFQLLKSSADFLKNKNINQWAYWLNPPKEKTQWVVEGFKKKEFYFIESKKKEIVGMVRILKEDLMYWGEMNDTATYIHSLVVDRKFSGKNIGTKVIHEIEKTASKDSIQYLRLDCDASNSKLCNYYESKGFSKIKSILLPLGKYNLYQKKIML